MIAEKMIPFVQNNSAIRTMFEEGNRLKKQYGADKVYDSVSYTHLDVYKRQPLTLHAELQVFLKMIWNFCGRLLLICSNMIIQLQEERWRFEN